MQSFFCSGHSGVLSGLLLASLLFVGMPAKADESVDSSVVEQTENPTSAAEYEAIKRWLHRMAEAVQRLNYTGTFVYFHNGRMDAMNIIHAMTADGEYEKLVSLTGDGREIHRTRNGVQCYLPSKRKVMVGDAGPRTPFRVAMQWDVDRLSEVYDFRYEGQKRIAGRACERIDVLPRDEYRYGYKLCLDAQTGMLLGTELVDNEGRAIEQMMFTDVEFPLLIPQSKLAPDVNTEGYVWLKHGGEKPAEAIVDGHWELNGMPAGFVASGTRPHALKVGHESTYQMVYSDGLASVSIFIEPLAAGRQPIEGGSRMGAITAWGSVVEGHQVTVMGDVPGHTAQHFGEGLRFVSAEPEAETATEPAAATPVAAEG